MEELTHQQRMTRARNAAMSTLIKAHRDEYNEYMGKETKARGLDWAPRPSEQETAREKFEALLAKHPELRDVLLMPQPEEDQSAS